jgi:hypothetical protein
MKLNSRVILTAVLLGMVFLVSACVTADYVGETYAPTTSVDMYYNAQDITRPHRTMGQLTLDSDDIVSTEKLQQKLREEAMSRGADAVLYTGMQKIQTAAVTNWEDTSKRKGKHTYESGTATTTYEEKKEMTAQLLKYTSAAATAG